MDRDYGKEIDGINAQLEEIKQLLTAVNKPNNKGFITTEMLDKIPPFENSDKRIKELMVDLHEQAENEGSTGAVSYFGFFSSGGMGSYWISEKVKVENLLKLIESNIATKVLACIGNNDRLNMLLALLRTPRTAAQLVVECGYNTTGQVYHHLKPLLAADLVKEDNKNRGSYIIQPHRVQGVIMLLAGISDMLDTKYTQGDWEPIAD